ncbi:RNA-binding protein 33 (RNA-binding motif protein 33) [Trypanosoma equiperdum]|uniref:RNA-binding protein 33 (RNA-binding motif protein 33) n=1 Tax=Trypanosoma equiperdum TaxID=5694 RepID=A0A1G4I9T7_TRYEQ|nr:RNA-binding protein 33 (RNA-binding motif protein 33) [Trypanosoma equiperdum]
MSTGDPTVPPEEEAISAEKCTRFFIGGLHRQITPQDVEEYFSNFGDVMTFILKRDPSGNSRGFGWVVFNSPPTGVQRPEPHYLKGVKLTVEPALANVRTDRVRRVPGGGSSIPGRRRERSLSDSSSVSSRNSSLSTGDPRDGVRRPRLYDRHVEGSRLPAFGAVASRLPPLPSEAFVQPPQIQATTFELAAPAPSRDAPAASASETYLCIPLSLCPPEFSNDPRTFCAKLDQSRVGGLSIIPSPSIAQVGPAPHSVPIPQGLPGGAVMVPQHSRSQPVRSGGGGGGGRHPKSSGSHHSIPPPLPQPAPPNYDSVMRHNS